MGSMPADRSKNVPVLGTEQGTGGTVAGKHLEEPNLDPFFRTWLQQRVSRKQMLEKNTQKQSNSAIGGAKGTS
jgi:hypothetical protein